MVAAYSARARVAEWNLGTSVMGCPLKVWAFAPEGCRSPEQPQTQPWRWFLLLAGVHGDEIEGVEVAQSILEGLLEEHPFEHVGVVVWPEANPDGVAGMTRCNANGVDLNRNLPTKDWTPEVKNPRYPPGPSAGSEPESKALLALIDQIKPVAILSAHSYAKAMVNSNGPARPWAEGLSALCGAPVTEDMGYPTPGCLGTYAGHERGIPTITLEILRGSKPEVYVPLHTMTVVTAIAYWDKPAGQAPSFD